jgi:hypothetical protein
MLINIDHKKLKKRIYSQFNIKNKNDFKSLKNKLKDQDVIFKISYQNFFFLKSQFDYNYRENSEISFKFKIKKFLNFELLKKKLFTKFKKIKNEIETKLYFNNVKLDKNIRTIIISKHKYVDEINLIPISQKIQKNHLILFKSLEIKKNYSSFFNKNSTKILLNKSIINILKGYYFFYKNKKHILENYPLKNISKNDLKNFYINFFIELEFYKRNFKNINPKNIIGTSFNGYEALVYYFKFYRKIDTKFIAYEIHGLGGDSCNYFYYLADILLVPGSIDEKIRKILLKNELNLLDIPKTKEVGSVRYYYWVNFLKKKTPIKKNNLNILFICSNPIYFKKNIEQKAINYLLKFAKKNKNINFIIKERPKFKNNHYNLNLNNISLVSKEKYFIEDLIDISDICIGTSSSSIVRQAHYYNKNVLQLFHHESHMAKLNQKIEINSYSKFELALNKIITNKNNFKYNTKELLNKNINPISKICEFLNN